METIRICIGTDRWQQESGAEKVLEYSIRKHCDNPVEITWMRSGDPGWEISEDGAGDSWCAGAAVAGGWVKSGKPGTWGTPFSCFRVAVPELMGFEGHAIYLDADMLLLDDISKLYALKPADGFGIRCIDHMRTDVSVIDCAWWKDKPWYPSIAQQKGIRGTMGQYMRLFRQHNALDMTLPREWNDIDGNIYDRAPESVKLLHYSWVPGGQPWCPYPNVEYPEDRPYIDPSVSSTAAAELWFAYENEMLEHV